MAIEIKTPKNTTLLKKSTTALRSTNGFLNTAADISPSSTSSDCSAAMAASLVSSSDSNTWLMILAASSASSNIWCSVDWISSCNLAMSSSFG
ncbi:hypothetical protein WICPIJ_008570 [Wickerhamomyces pijperi]|uniref:Uncharacterized protein n=1 Tax=Wickerhamomyces pijperi TaxID=599730 RepID=A0A9P8PYQ4_WICPI|nr:hypothetical protein WICPIJ_008570 [Wickerhamomyces pijperi]